MRTLDVVDGAAGFKAALDTGHLGSNRIDAYIVGADGNLVRTGRTIFVRGQGALSVEMTADQPQYLPGQPARVTFSIKDETGAPAVAALGVQVVDEAVFALVDSRPGLLRTYFELEDRFAQPTYEIHPPIVDLESLLFTQTASTDKVAASAAQNQAAAVFAALGDGGTHGHAAGQLGKRGSSGKDAARALLRDGEAALAQDRQPNHRRRHRRAQERWLQSDPVLLFDEESDVLLVAAGRGFAAADRLGLRLLGQSLPRRGASDGSGAASDQRARREGEHRRRRRHHLRNHRARLARRDEECTGDGPGHRAWTPVRCRPGSSQAPGARRARSSSCRAPEARRVPPPVPRPPPVPAARPAATSHACARTSPRRST